MAKEPVKHKNEIPRTPADILRLVEQARSEWAELFEYQYDPNDSENLEYDKDKGYPRNPKRESIRTKVFSLLDSHFESMVLTFLGFEQDSWSKGLKIKQKTTAYDAIEDEVVKHAGPFFKKLLKGLKPPTKKMEDAAQRMYSEEFAQYIQNNIREHAQDSAKQFLDQLLARENAAQQAILDAALGLRELAAESEENP